MSTDVFIYLFNNAFLYFCLPDTRDSCCFSGITWRSLTWSWWMGLGQRSSCVWGGDWPVQGHHCALMFLSPPWWSAEMVRLTPWRLYYQLLPGCSLNLPCCVSQVCAVTTANLSLPSRRVLKWRTQASFLSPSCPWTLTDINARVLALRCCNVTRSVSPTTPHPRSPSRKFAHDFHDDIHHYSKVGGVTFCLSR